MECLKVYSILLVAVVLTACGGGGGGGSDEISSDDTGNNSAPELSVLGGENIVVDLNSDYQDAGAEALDAEDGDISASIVVDGSVDTSAAGTYTITYNVADSEGLEADTASRNVLVVTPLALVVDTDLELDVESIADPDGGTARAVAAVSSSGKKAHFVENELIIATDDFGEVESFLLRWGGVLIETLELEGIPDMHTVSVDPTDLTIDNAEEQIEAVSELAFGDVLFSSDNTLKLYAIVATEMAERDLVVSLNWVTLNQSIASGSTSEEVSTASTVNPYVADAFQWPYMNQGSAQDTGAASAWQLLELLGINSTERIMVIDSGFVDIGDYPSATVPAGAGWGSRSTAGCSSPSCYWHGTEVAHVALAVPDNGVGVAGAAGPHARLEPVQFSGIDLRGVAQIFSLLLSAPFNGPPAVVNISGSADIPGPFNAGLNRLLDPLFDRALDFGVLVVAAAGNEGSDVDSSFRFFFTDIERSTVIPCETSSVICVGGMEWDSTDLDEGAATVSNDGSNYGTQAERDSVDIYASYEFWAPEVDDSGVSLGRVKSVRGTSFSAPFVSGVIAMMAAANPSMDAEQRASCLLRSAHQGDDVRVHLRGGNQRRVDAYEAVLCALGSRARFPLLRIDSPTDGQSAAGRSDLILNAASLGSEGLPLSVSWSSDVDGAIGGSFSSGVDVAWPNLSIGTHLLTAEVTNSDGAVASEIVTVTITNNAPTARILSPSEGQTFGVAQSINLRAIVEDLDAFPSGELEDSQISWSIDGNSYRGTGSSATIPVGQLPLGDYTLRLVADDGTDTTEETVNFSVVECTGSCPTAAIISPNGDINIRTSLIDDEGRIYADVDFEGFATDDEDGDFAGRLNDGPMRWTAVNEEGLVTNICTPTEIGPPLSPVVVIQACDSFTTRLYLGLSELSQRYVIELEVTDSDGNLVTDSVAVTLEYDLI